MRIVLMMGLLMFTTNLSATKIAYINAKIFTGTDISKDTAFLVDNGRFLEFGDAEHIKAKAKDIPVVDLKHALVMPGFIEAHAHLLGLGQSKVALDLRNLSQADIVKKVSDQVHAQSAGTWITGRGWDQNHWVDKSFPHKDSLKGIKNPVYLRRVDGHAVWINDAAIKLAGIDDQTKDPAGGQIIRDPKGKATGVLIDNAIDLVSKYVDKPTRRDLELYLQLAVKEALSLGITSFHDAGSGTDAIALFEDMAQKNQLKLRLNVMIDGQEQQLVDRFLARGPLIGDFLTVRSIKYFADGALGSRGAWLLEPYHDHAHHQGLLLIDKKDLTEKTKKAIAAGFQIATHAIGDGANRLVLDAYEDALKTTKAKNARLRVEHAQLVDPADHKRFSDLAVIASMQPIHCTSDMAWVPDRLGQSRVKDRAYPWRSLLNKGVVLAFGSDAPVEDINPILGLYASVTRADMKSIPKDGFLPEQKLKLTEALRGYHEGAAFAEFNEHQKGKIAPGYLADFAVFDTDLLHPEKKSFLDAKPFLTVVNGEVVYQRDASTKKGST